MGWNSQNITNLLIIVAGQGFSGLFVYNPSPGTGNLVASIASAAGTDPYGNAYVPDIAAYGSGAGAGPSIAQLASGGSFPSLNLFTGGASEFLNFSMIGDVFDPGGAAEQILCTLFGPTDTGSHDRAWVQLLSSHNNAANSAQGRLIYEDTSAFEHQCIVWGDGMPQVITPAGEIGTITQSQTDTTAHTDTVTGITAITEAWAIGAGDLNYTDASYELELWGGGTWGTVAMDAEFVVTIGGVNIILANAAQFIATSDSFVFYAKVTVAVETTGASGTVEAGGLMALTNTTTGAGSIVAFSNSGTISTTAATTMAFGWDWTSGPNSATVTCNASTFKKTA